ncbi:hypothetical protein FNV43_RR19868 [Rhamnella rubrinervis]|uniref:Pentatricopeptide repeat-containing protein n=1 Tax=Rhamnella rubrinervis TaxID=2594499 RepID=A0A8K0E0E7_9ROSA|nr:hypothetical protein FNV43_RR19868 [Rhamnella rubrinervis]
MGVEIRVNLDKFQWLIGERMVGGCRGQFAIELPTFEEIPVVVLVLLIGGFVECPGLCKGCEPARRFGNLPILPPPTAPASPLIPPPTHKQTAAVARTPPLSSPFSCLHTLLAHSAELSKKNSQLRKLNKHDHHISRVGYRRLENGLFVSCCTWEEADKLISEIPENDTACWMKDIIYRFSALRIDMYEQAFNYLHGDGITIDELVVEAVLHCCRKCVFIPDCMEMGKLTHCLVVKIGIESDVELQNGLIGMYSVYGERLYAQNLFYAACWLHQSSWSFMIRTYLRYDLFENARVLFESMPKKGLTTRIDMISYYSKHDCFSKSLALFQEMLRSGIRPEKMSLYRIITDLTIRFAALDLCKCVHPYSI